MTCAYCTRFPLMISYRERLPKIYFVAFVLFIHILQNRCATVRRILLPFLCRVYKASGMAALPVFVALEIFGGANMEFLRRLRLIGACFRLAGGFGLVAGVKYCLGFLSLDDSSLESSVFAVGGHDA